MKPHPLTLTGMLALCLTVSAAFAAESSTATSVAKSGPAWGAADVQPTPENPVYFRWTLGHFPGAQPPLEFWDGTAALVDREVNGKKTKIWDFTDTKSKNIQWKARVPGWALSHPIVVGNPSTPKGSAVAGPSSPGGSAAARKVFAVGHPDFVTCWDLETGKQLWQRRIMPLMLEGLPSGKIPARPALPEEQAAKVQKLIDLAQALWTVTDGGPGVGASGQTENMYGRDRIYKQSTLEKRKEFAAKICAMAQRCRPDVVAHGDDALVKALDKDIASLQGFASLADEAALDTYAKKERMGVRNYWKAVSNAFRVPFGKAWYGEVGYADSTLASDGQRIYGVFNQGQAFCLDLDGKVLWGFQDQVPDRDNRVTFHRSPLLCEGLLLFSDYKSGPVVGGSAPTTMRAFDSKTGKLRWASHMPGCNYPIPRVVNLARPDGTVEPVLVGVGLDRDPSTGGFPILRVKDGVKVGELPRCDPGRGLLLGVVKDAVMFSSGSDTGGGDNSAYRLQWTGPDTVTAQSLFVTTKEGKNRPWGNQFDFPTVFDKYWFGAREGSWLFNATTGEKVGGLKSPSLHFPVVAGHYLIGMAEHTGPGHRDSTTKAIGRFVVVDVKDPANPKVVSDKNLLGFAEPPSDIFIEQYYKDIDPYQFVGCYAGAAANFMRMGCPVPIGNKLLIQSSAFLYCIGEK